MILRKARMDNSGNDRMAMRSADCGSRSPSPEPVLKVADVHLHIGNRSVLFRNLFAKLFANIGDIVPADNHIPIARAFLALRRTTLPHSHSLRDDTSVAIWRESSAELVEVSILGNSIEMDICSGCLSAKDGCTSCRRHSHTFCMQPVSRGHSNRSDR